MENKTALIIPAFNEESTIRKVIKDFAHFSKELDIYVINNNSTDRTEETARNTFKEINYPGKVINVKEQGKANAIREAFRLIDADIYVMTDGDHTYFAEDLQKLIKPISDEKYDMAVGNRFTTTGYEKENKRIFHSFGNKLVRNLINLLFKTNLQDIMSGYRVFSRRFVKNYPIMCKGFEIETEMTLHALDKRFRIKEVPITYKDRSEGSESKLNTYKDGYRILKTIFTIFKDYKPFLFFTFIALICLIAGLILGSVPVYEYIMFRYVYRVPTAILATGFVIVAILLFAIGLILDTVAKYQKFNYELRVIKNDK